MDKKMIYKGLIFNLVLTAILVTTLGFNYNQERALRDEAAQMQGQPPTIGTEIPDFYIQDENGKQLRFRELYTQDVLLVLWSTSCTPSVWALDVLDNIASESTSIKVVPVSIADTTETIKKFFNEKGWDFPVLVDSAKSTKWAFKANISPALYLIDSEGIIQHRQLGLSQQGIDFLSKWIDNVN